jgi:hypothetical protein
MSGEWLERGQSLLLESMCSPTQYCVILSVSLSLLLPGCGGETGPTCHPVAGKVLYQNQPLAEAMVVFHPLTTPLEKFPQPMGTTTADGRFVMTTFQSGDGAPEGEYAITIELREPRQIGEEVVRDGLNLLPPKYASHKDTPLRHKVIPGKNEVPEIKVE